ncbi:MAG: WYL domain-containing protein, partial [Brachybacterium sp.]|nr:WYL domain-containing protein [Brachybacterium sp.]
PRTAPTIPVRPSGTDHLSRLIAEASFVLHRGEARLSDLAAEFGVSEQRIVEDLQVLFLCGDLGAGWEDLIDAEWEEGVVRVRNADALRRPLRLTAPEATALLAGLAALETASGTDPHIDSARGALQHLLAGDDLAGKTAGSPAPVTTPPGEDGASTPSDPGPTAARGAEDRIRDGLRAALAADRAVTLRYSPPDRVGTWVRRVHPIALENTGGRGYLRAHDQDADGERTFRLDRIVELVADDSPRGPDERARAAMTTGHPAPEEAWEPPVWLRLEPAGTWVAEEFDAAEVRDLPTAGSGILARLDDPVREALIAAVLESAGAAEVLAPSGLRDLIVTRSQDAAQRHRDPEAVD